MTVRCKGCLTAFDPPKGVAKVRCPACGVPHHFEAKPQEKKAPKKKESLGFPEVENLPSVPAEEIDELEKTTAAPPRKDLLRQTKAPPRKMARPARRRARRTLSRLAPQASLRSFLLALFTIVVLFFSWIGYHVFYREPTKHSLFEKHLLEAYEYYDAGQDAKARESLEKAREIDPDSLLIEDLAKRLSE